MKYEILIVAFIILLSASGCSTPNPNTKSVKNIQDVSFQIAKNGNVNLKKEYISKDGNKTSEIVSISKNNTELTQDYEKVPNYFTNNTKNLKLKQKQLKKKKIRVYGKKVKVSVENIPLNEFIDLIFSKVLQMNYTVSQEVKSISDPITLNIMKPQNRQDVFDIVKKILSLHGVEINSKNNILFISKSNSKTNTQIAQNIYIGFGREIPRDIEDNEKIMMFVSYKYIDPRNAQSIIRKSGVNVHTYYYSKHNYQIMEAPAAEIRKALSLINLLDKPFFEDKEMYLVHLNNIEVNDFYKHIQSIFKSEGIKVSSFPMESALVVNPIKALNSLLLISPEPQWTKLFMYWKKKLDVISQSSPIPQFYTYKVQNRKADELAEALNSVIDIKLAPIEKKIQEKNNKSGTNAQLKHTIKYDLATNTLMMQMLPAEYREILPLIEQLDALPKQVLVEVTLAEVTLTNDFSLGFEYALRNNAAAKVAGSPTDTLITAAVKGTSGLTASYLSKNIDVIVNAYAGKKLLNILSKPRLLILNNETGNINVGTQVPVITSQTSANDIGGVKPSINQNIKYITTGVIAGLSPTINSNGILTMKVNLKLSEAQINDTSGIDSPLIVTRDLSTTLTLKSGRTVLLGGLISRNKSSSDGGVPFLMDIPWLGTLFKSQSNKTVKTELIMLIEPVIMQNTADLNDRTKRFRKILHLLDEYSFN